MSRSKFRRVYYDVCTKNNIELLNILIRSKFLEKEGSSIIQPLYNAIDKNNIDVFKTIVENTRFFIRYDYENKELIDCAVNKGRLEILMYLFENLRVDHSYKIYILTNSIAKLNESISNKLIFDYLCDKIKDIQYDDFVVLRNTIYYNKEYAFDKLIQKDCLNHDISRLRSVLYDCIAKDELRYLKKLVNLDIFDVGFDNNYLLKTSISHRFEQIPLYLLEQPNVIDEQQRITSLYKSIEICITEHNAIHNKINIIKKIISLDFIDISHDNNKILITALEYNKNEIVNLLLSNPKIDLSKDNPKFSVINYVDDKLAVKLINIDSFRKYIDPYKEQDIRPKYKPKKIIRTINE